MLGLWMILTPAKQKRMLERKALTEGHIELTKMLSNEEMRFTASFMKFLMEDRSEYSAFFKKQSLWLD